MPQLSIQKQSNKDIQKVRRIVENVEENEKEEEEESEYLTTKCYENGGDFTLEHEQNLNAPFNNESSVVVDGCCSQNQVAQAISQTLYERRENFNGPLKSDKLNEARDFKNYNDDEHTYENLTYEKELLLHKFFRSRNVIYENLCRGCGYGVFEARGELCYFCASIVNGVRNTPGSNSASISAPASATVSNTELDFFNNTNNIYENICEKCFTIYNTDICENCVLKQNVNKSKKNLKNLISSNDELSSKPINGDDVKKTKRGIFQGIIGSLKRVPKSPKTNKSNSASKLEIIHNVDGYEHVFRTQETFDLQRICELKQAQQTSSSSSEQHIYGRLKFAGDKTPEVYSTSTQTLPLTKTDFQQKQNLTKAESESSYLNFQTNNNCKSTKTLEKSKRPRISKPRLLRVITSAKQQHFVGKIKTPTVEEFPAAAVIAHNFVSKQQQQSLYLPVNVCNWMTSLRREIHSYQNFSDDLCNPKSIPAKNFLSAYKTIPAYKGAINEYYIETARHFVTNTKNINDVIDFSVKSIDDKPNSDVSSIESLETSSNTTEDNEFATVTLRSLEQVFEFDAQTPVACTQMVNDFMRNFHLRKITREMSEDNENQQLKSKSKLEENCKNEMEILERRELTTAKRQAQRAKRQGIYLKTHEINDIVSVTSNNNNSKIREIKTAQTITTINTQNNGEHVVHNVVDDDDEKSIAADIICYANNKQKIPNENGFETELDSTALSLSPVSRRRTASASGRAEFKNNNINNNTNRNHSLDSRKRCGVYDLKIENEFVGDILSDFDKYLQHEEAAIAAAEAEAKVNSIEEKLNLSPSLKDNNKSIAAAAYRKTEKGSPTDPTTTGKDIKNILKPLSLVTPSVENNEKQNTLEHFINELHLARSLHRIVISYAQPLHAFLKAIHIRYPSVYAKWPRNRLNRKYKRFHKYCIEKKKTLKALPTNLRNNNNNQNKFSESLKKIKNQDKLLKKNKENFENFENVSTTTKIAVNVDVDDDDILKAKRNSVKIIVQQVKIQDQSDKSANEMVTKTTTTMTSEKSNDQNKQKFDQNCATNEIYNINHTTPKNNIFEKQMPLKPHRLAPKKPEPPQVPQRDPKTALSSKFPMKIKETESQEKIVTSNEESIYHPIWNFKTVGNVPERYETDVDYYEIGENDNNDDDDDDDNDDGDHLNVAQAGKKLQTDTDSLASFVINTENDIEEDHGEWETDDEFMFTTDTMLSTKSIKPDASSLHSSIAPSSSLSGSTVAGFSSSTATLASGISVSLTHHLLRNICIFYSLTEPKLRAIVYDYDRVHASAYFGKRLLAQTKSDSPCSHHSNESNANDSGIGKSPKLKRSPIPPPRTTSMAKVGPNGDNVASKKSSESGCHVALPKTPQLLPDSVLAWKFMLLDVNYLEDEEDMIVSETEIKRAQEIKEDIDTRQTQQLNILQRFKSASFGNLVDLPNEDDKIGIGSAIDRMRNKLQRGVFKINVRSPKSDKKNRGIFRKTEVTSLYLEDGMKPKYPIFGEPLEKLEMDQTTYHNVPRFVVDCVAYIEQKDCILQEGLYRASGNKVSVEDLKRKLSESYIYDPKLLVTDDIHTLTSLLKLFFRELGAPLIPQEIYERLGRNLSDAAGIEVIRDAFEDICEPNLSTLKFLIKHLTNVAACSSENRMPASNLAIVWGPCLLSANQIEFDIGRMNTLAKVLIENYARIFNESERLVA